MIIIHVRKLISVENGREKNRGGKKRRIGIKENKGNEVYFVRSAGEISKAGRNDRDLTERSYRRRVEGAMAKGGGRNEPQLRKMRAAN